MNRFTVRDSAEEINVQESWLSCRMKAVLSVKAASKSRLHAVLFPYLKMRPIPQYEIEEKICIVIDIQKMRFGNPQFKNIVPLIPNKDFCF